MLRSSPVGHAQLRQPSKSDILRLIRSKGVHAYDTTGYAGDFTMLYRQQRRSNHRLLLRQAWF